MRHAFRPRLRDPTINGLCLDFAKAVDSAGYQVASHDRSNAFGSPCHNEVSGREHHRFRYEGNDFRHTPDQFGYIRVLFHDAVYRQPQPALGGVAYSFLRVQRRDDGRQIESLPPVPRPALFSRGELKITAGQIVADGIAVDTFEGALAWNGRALME